MQLLEMYPFAGGFTGHFRDCGFNFQINGVRYSFEFEGEYGMTALSDGYYSCLTDNNPYIL